MKQNLSYTSRDYDSIKNDLNNSISSLTSIWTNREPSDPGMVLTNLIASMGDNLSFNMDKQSLEFYGRTVTQRKNAQHLFDLIDYKMHWYESAQLELTVHNLSKSNALTLVFNPTGSNTQRIVSKSINSAPPYFILNPIETPYNWNENTLITIPPEQSETFTAVQGTLNSLKFSSAAIDENNRYYLPVTKIDQNHIWLLDEDDAFKWYITNNINELTETLPRFEFNVDEYNMPYIEFVPYWRSSFMGDDDTEKTFTLYYLSTLGAAGDVTNNVLDYISGIRSQNENSSSYDTINDVSIIHETNAYYTDNSKNIPGKDPETAHQAYLNSRNYTGTYNTLVTLHDFEKFYKRIGLIYNSFAIDGQRALDLNENILESYNKIKFDDINNESQSNNIKADGNGFRPYTLNMLLVAGNFMESDPLTPTKYYANSVEVKPENTDYGYMKYSVTPSVASTDSTALVNQTNLDDCKLINTNIYYGSVRKFPFFIDGELHLKEPVTPAKANLILQKVYLNIYSNFTADKLTFGKKIKFSDVIAVINESDDLIDYFDAGANNSHGSLFVYPKKGDLNPYKLDDNDEIASFDINVDIKYFNPISMQHYEDILPDNNKYMYWTETASGSLSIAADSILEKTTPVLNDLSAYAQFNKIKYKPSGSSEEKLVIDSASVFIDEVDKLTQKNMVWGLVKTYETLGTDISNTKTYSDEIDYVPISDKITITKFNEKTDWSYTDEAGKIHDMNTDSSGYFVFAIKMLGTKTTKESKPTFIGLMCSKSEFR